MIPLSTTKIIAIAVVAIIAVGALAGYLLLMKKEAPPGEEEIPSGPAISAPPVYSENTAIYLSETTIRGLPGSTYSVADNFEDVVSWYKTKMEDEGWTKVAEYSGSITLIYEKGDKRAVIVIDQTEGGVLLSIAYGPKTSYAAPSYESIENTSGGITPAENAVVESVTKSGLIATDPQHLRISIPSAVKQFIEDQNLFPGMEIPSEVQLLVLITSGTEAETYLVIGLDTSIDKYITAATVSGKQLDVLLDSIPEALSFVGQHIIIADNIEELQPTSATADQIISSPSTYAFKRVVLPETTTYSLVSTRVQGLEILGHIGFGHVSDHFGSTDLSKYLWVIDPYQTETQIRVTSVTGTVIYPTEGIKSRVQELLSNVLGFTSENIETIIQLPAVLYIENISDDSAQLITIQQLTSSPASYHGEMVSIEGIALGVEVETEDIPLINGIPLGFTAKIIGVTDGTSSTALVGLSSEKVGTAGTLIFGKYRFELSVYTFQEGLLAGQTFSFLISKEAMALSITEAPLDHVTISLTSATVEMSGTQEFTAQAYDANNNPLSNIMYGWSVSPLTLGTVWPWTGTSTTFTGSSLLTGTGTVTVTAIQGITTKTSSVNISVTSAEAALDHVTITAPSTSVQTGGTLSLSAQGYDADDNAVSGVSYVWVVTGLTLSTCSPSTGSSSTFTGGSLTGTATVTVTATKGLTIKTSSVNISVTSGAPSSISIVSGNNQSASKGSTLSPFVVVVKDSSGNPVPDVTVNWSILINPYWLETTGSLSATSTATNSSGQASSTLTLGSGWLSNQTYTVTATVSGYPLLISTFTATAT